MKLRKTLYLFLAALFIVTSAIGSADAAAHAPEKAVSQESANFLKKLSSRLMRWRISRVRRS